MRTQSLTHAADRAIATLASRQHGVVARWQLLDSGLTARQVKLRLRYGRLHEIRQLASAPELRDELERNPGKRGSATLRIVLDLPGGPARTHSPAERQMLRLSARQV
jgi:hypothetical protein